jgi:hypothetical protein
MMTTARVSVSLVKTCSTCGAHVGRVVEIEKNGVLLNVLQVGNQYILDERALCAVCLQPVYWNTSISKLESLLRMITGLNIPYEELEKNDASKTS